MVSQKGEIMAVKITPGSDEDQKTAWGAVFPKTDDRAPLEGMVAGLKGKLLGDKGNISKKLFAQLWGQRLHLITGIRRSMRNHFTPVFDKLLLRSRFIVETFVPLARTDGARASLDKLTTDMGVEHPRHRSPTNAFVHVLSCLAAYMLGKRKVQMTSVAYQ